VKLLKNTLWIDQEIEIWTSDEVNTEVISGLSLGDTIKAMYITLEGMTDVGVSTSSDSMMMWGDLRGMWGGGWWGGGPATVRVRTPWGGW
jgi:hypothetical protein